MENCMQLFCTTVGSVYARVFAVCLCYLWWITEVEGLIEAEVDKAKQCGVELCESGHDSVIHICRVLNTTTNTHILNFKCPQHGCTNSSQRVLG